MNTLNGCRIYGYIMNTYSGGISGQPQQGDWSLCLLVSGLQIHDKSVQINILGTARKVASTSNKLINNRYFVYRLNNLFNFFLKNIILIICKNWHNIVEPSRLWDIMPFRIGVQKTNFFNDPAEPSDVDPHWSYADPDPQNLVNADQDNKITKLISTHILKVKIKKLFQIYT